MELFVRGAGEFPLIRGEKTRAKEGLKEIKYSLNGAKLYDDEAIVSLHLINGMTNNAFEAITMEFMTDYMEEIGVTNEDVSQWDEKEEEEYSRGLRERMFEHAVWVSEYNINAEILVELHDVLGWVVVDSYNFENIFRGGEGEPVTLSE